MDLYTIRNKIMSGKSIQELNLRVCFYARVSTEKDEQLHSLKAQINFFNDYISKNPNWKFVDSYIDEGLSGTRVNKREQFLKMINDAKKNKFDLILTKEISRFSRNTLDSIKYTQDLLSYGVGVYFLNDNINTILPDSELRLTLMSSIAQDEVRKLSERVSFGMKRSIENGVVLGCSNIYGYIKEKGKLVILEKEAEMIRIIFDRYATTTDGLSKLSRYLYDLGYKSKSGKKIDVSILTRIIKNPKYKGFYCGHKSKILDYRTKKKKNLDISEWVLYKDEKNVPPIVSEKLWKRANDKLKKRQESFANKSNDKIIFQNRYTYSGKIYCKCHNLTYHRSSSGKRKNNPVWECQEYRRNGLKGCSNPRVFEKELDILFKALFSKLLSNENIIFDEILEECKQYFLKNNNELEINNLKVKLLNLDNKKNKLLELVMENIISKDEYKKQITLINEESRKYKRDINYLNEQILSDEYINKKIKEIKSLLLKAVDDKETFQDLFNELVDKIVVDRKSQSKVNLSIILKNGELVNASSDIKGKKFHFVGSDTTNSRGICCD